MRLLHLTPELPAWPGGTGGATRQFHLLRRLVELGHEVTVVAPVPDGDDGARDALALAGVRLVESRRPASRLAESARALLRDPRLPAAAVTRPVLAWQVGVFWAAMRPLAIEAIESERPDMVMIEHDNAAAWVGDLPADLQTVLVLHNAGPEYYRSRAAASSGPARAAFGLESRRFRRHHARWLGRYSLLIAVSEADARSVSPHGRPPVEVVPNGVASEELLPAPPSSEPETLLFTGTLSHPPNSEGIRWFAEHAWPRVLAQRPGARLLVVGRGPPREVAALGRRDGIEVVGPVPDIAPWLARATAVLAPLLSGGGTRLKILEAFAARRAVVSTRVGCEGLEVEDGRHLLVRDGAGPFAEAVLELLADRGLRERLADQGRETAETAYDWNVLGDRLGAALELTRSAGAGPGRSAR